MAIIVGAEHTADHLTTTIREDLSDVITMISPYDTPFFSMLQTVAATSTKHEWIRDSLTATTSAGALEGDQFLGVTLVDPTRANNHTQILRKDFAVTGTNEAVTHAGMASQFSYQMMKALRELARNTEQALLCQKDAGTPAGAGGTARTMNGLYHEILDDAVDNFIFDVIGTDGTGAPVTSGTALQLAEDDFNALLQRMWTAGVAPDTILASPAAKKDITAYAGSSIARFNVGKNDLVSNVMRYESDFGTVDVILERFGPTGHATPDGDEGRIATVAASKTAFALERQHLRKATLRPTVAERLPKSGDSERGMVLHELTLEVAAVGAAGAWVNILDD
jgi:hypothetical protein